MPRPYYLSYGSPYLSKASPLEVILWIHRVNWKCLPMIPTVLNSELSWNFSFIRCWDWHGVVLASTPVFKRCHGLREAPEFIQAVISSHQNSPTKILGTHKAGARRITDWLGQPAPVQESQASLPPASSGAPTCLSAGRRKRCREAVATGSSSAESVLGRRPERKRSERQPARPQALLLATIT